MLMAGTAAYAAGPREVSRRVIFMIDRSGSMPLNHNPDGTPRTVPFAEEVSAAARAAQNVLDDVEKSGETSVGFYTFGNRDALTPFSPDALDLSPSESRKRLTEFFSTDGKKYSQKRTYIAYSIFNLVKQQLGLGDSFTTSSDVPADAPLLNVFVFTDGGEDVDLGFDNSPYEKWMTRQQGRLQVLWRAWKFFPRTVKERDDRDHDFGRSPNDSVVYSVQFGEPSEAYSFSVLEPPANRTVPLGISRLIRLMPAIGGDALDGALAAGATACTAEPLQTRPSPTLMVQAQIDWPARSAATSEWTIRAPAREVSSAPVREIVRKVIPLMIEVPANAVLDTSATPGRYPARLIRASLCDELRRVYPSSTFVFPASDDNRLPPLGYISVESVPLYKFTIASQDATRPNDALTKITFDGWQQVHAATRRLRVTSDGGVHALVDLTVLVRKGGKTSPAAANFVSLSAGGKSGGNITVQPGEVFTLRVPAKPQTWLDSVLGRGYREEPGDYDVILRVRPRVISASSARHKTQVLCEYCDPARFLRGDDYASVTMPVHIDAMPVTIVAKVIATILSLIVLWILIRWITRPRFPHGLVIGKLQGQAPDLRAAHEAGLRGKLAVYKRRPLFVDLRENGRTIARQMPYVDDEAKISRDLLGMRPGSDRIHVWCVTKRGGDDERMELRGRRLDPIGQTDVPPEHKKLLQILHNELKQPNDLTIVGNGGEDVRTYTIKSLR